MCLVLTPDQAHDAQGLAPPLLMLAKQANAPLADKGHDAGAIRSTPAKRTVPTRRSPPKATAARPIPRDRGRCRLRGLIERLSDKPKCWRGARFAATSPQKACLGLVAPAYGKPWPLFVHDA